MLGSLIGLFDLRIQFNTAASVETPLAYTLILRNLERP